MRHLIISREYPPAPYAAGGIGTYVANIARLMAERGETVHVVGQRWSGAPLARETLMGGRLFVHRLSQDDLPGDVDEAERLRLEVEGLASSDSASRWFSLSAGLLAERLIEEEGIDVVEAQEWEAPLHHLLARRALGLGPDRRPPCIVHLHSATAFIRHHNGFLVTPRSYRTMTRMETFCIASADALLCPSRYYARQCTDFFDLPEDRIRVIPLPVGRTPRLERSFEAWASGPICFVGRLEPRKGVIEWVEAASRVAAEDPSLTLDFIGAEIMGLRSPLLRNIDRALRPRFRFHGARTRAEIAPYLAAARAAVVPSRWENFPNVCLEAMGSGLPVIATRLGGMVEMVEDGRTGWLAPDTGVAGMVDGLAAALRRCLAETPETRAAMGQAAIEAVSRLCNNAAMVDSHLALRAEVAARGPWRSNHRCAAGRAPIVATVAPRSGAGVVISAPSLDAAIATLRSVRAQVEAAVAVAVVCAVAPDHDSQARAESGDVLVHHAPGAAGAAAWNEGFRALRDRPIDFWLFLDHHDVLRPACLARMAAVFARCPEIGLLSPWTRRPGTRSPLEAPVGLDPEAQLIANDATPASAFRDTALTGEEPFRGGMPREYDVWELANRVLVGGWTGAPLPELLAERRVASPAVDLPAATSLLAVRAEALTPLAPAVSPTVLTLIHDYVPAPGLAAGALPLNDENWPLFLRVVMLASDPPRAVDVLRRRAQRIRSKMVSLWARDGV